jgi:hypothetical protein
MPRSFTAPLRADALDGAEPRSKQLPSVDAPPSTDGPARSSNRRAAAGTRAPAGHSTSVANTNGPRTAASAAAEQQMDR